MAAQEYVGVSNWERMQHYRDRRPAWIKLHAEILDDYEFQRLPEIAQAQLLKLWVLASQLSNAIPKDAAWIRAKIGSRSTVDLDLFISGGWIEVLSSEQVTERRAADEKLRAQSHGKCKRSASIALAERLRDATPETETEKEKDPPLTPQGEGGGGGVVDLGEYEVWSHAK